MKTKHVPARHWDDRVYSLIKNNGLATRGAVARSLPECGPFMLKRAFSRLLSEGRITAVARGWYVPCQ
jgi:N-acyl-L-homoserine lactone synthetase